MGDTLRRHGPAAVDLGRRRLGFRSSVSARRPHRVLFHARAEVQPCAAATSGRTCSVMEPDGANIHQIGKNNLFDNHGTLLPDGRIMYARWEYVDRNFGDAHGIWTVNPDGTNQAVYWGNNTASPGGIYYPPAPSRAASRRSACSACITIGCGGRWPSSTAGWVSTAAGRCCAPGRPMPSTGSAPTGPSIATSSSTSIRSTNAPGRSPTSTSSARG